MASWASQRKLIYGSVAVIVVVGAIIVPSFFLFYKAPTCTDGAQNQGERGIDCGGPCVKLCQSDFLPPIVQWVKFEEVVPGLYNVAAYIINQNNDGGVLTAPYTISLYDNRGIPITDASGSVTIDPHRNALAFIGSVGVGQRIPSKAVFEFDASPQWQKSRDALEGLKITDKKYDEDDTSSSLQAYIQNPTLKAISNLNVFAVLYGADGNALGFSKTIVDRIEPGDTIIAPYTWPVSRHGAVATIEIMPIVSPVPSQ